MMNNTSKIQAKHITNANCKNIILNETATKIYNKLVPIFSRIETYYIKKLCHDYIKDDGQQDEAIIIIVKNLVEMYLKCDYLTRAQYSVKKKIKKEYTTDFQIKQFLETFPDPFFYFENRKRKCLHNPHALNFLKYYFNEFKVIIYNLRCN